jgi:Protein of unknown function (DUF3040)
MPIGSEMWEVTGVMPPAGRRVASMPGWSALFRWRSRARPRHKLGREGGRRPKRLAWDLWEGTVPLSEHEQRQLEQIEAALRAGDPRFAEAVRAADPRAHYRRRVITAALGLLAGVGLLLAGVVVNVILVAVAGFVVMLACSLWGVTCYRRMTGTASGHAPVVGRGSGKKRHAAGGRRVGKPAGSGLMGRLEERWRRRQHGGR